MAAYRNRRWFNGTATAHTNEICCVVFSSQLVGYPLHASAGANAPIAFHLLSSGPIVTRVRSERDTHDSVIELDIDDRVDLMDSVHAR
jgi:hypothetical protein